MRLILQHQQHAAVDDDSFEMELLVAEAEMTQTTIIDVKVLPR